MNFKFGTWVISNAQVGKHLSMLAFLVEKHLLGDECVESHLHRHLKFMPVISVKEA